MSDAESALADSTRRLEKNPGDLPALMMRAEACLGLCDAAAALRDTERGLEILTLATPQYAAQALADLRAFLLTLKSRAQGALGDWSGALETAQSAVREGPGCLESLVQRGRARRELGDRTGAMGDFDAALVLDPRYAPAYVARAMVREGLGDFAAALADYDTALGLDPSLGAAWGNRGSLRLRIEGDTQQAERDLREGLRLDPRLSLARAKLAWLEHKRGDTPAGLRTAREGLRYLPGDPALLSAVAEMCQAVGRLPEALEALQTALRSHPEHAGVLALRGRMRGSAGDLEGALADLSRAVRLNAGDAAAWFNLALAHLHRGEFGPAAEALDRVLTLDPADAEARRLRRQLAETLPPAAVKEGSTDEWERELDAALQAKDPRREAQAHVELARLAHARQDLPGAVRHSERVLEIGRRIGAPRLEHLGLGNLGAMRFLSGRTQEGADLVGRACVLARESGDKNAEAKYCRDLGFMLLKLVRPVECLAAFERAQQLRLELGVGRDAEIDEIQLQVRSILGRA